MGLLSILHFMSRQPAPAAPAVTETYRRAMAESGDLIDRIRDASETPSPARAVMCAVWNKRHDFQYLATMFEAGQEAATPKALPE